MTDIVCSTTLRPQALYRPEQAVESLHGSTWYALGKSSDSVDRGSLNPPLPMVQSDRAHAECLKRHIYVCNESLLYQYLIFDVDGQAKGPPYAMVFLHVPPRIAVP